MGFSALDYLVLVAYLSGITIFGMQFRRSQHTVRDYFIGQRKTPWIVISLSIVAAETSTLTVIGVPALMYGTFAHPEQGGSLTYLQVVIGYIIARFLIAGLLIPKYFQGHLMTAYALLEARFGVTAKHVAASLFLIMRSLAEGVRVFAASLVFGLVFCEDLLSFGSVAGGKSRLFGKVLADFIVSNHGGDDARSGFREIKNGDSRAFDRLDGAGPIFIRQHNGDDGLCGFFSRFGNGFRHRFAIHKRRSNHGDED